MKPTELEADLQALARRTARGIPPLLDTMRAVSSVREKGTLMRKPGYIVASVSALGLCVLPIPVQRTIGYEIKLALPGSVNSAEIGNRLARALHADGITATPGLVTARVPPRAHGEVVRAAERFAQGLTERGIAAQAEVSTRTQRGYSTALAMVYDRIVRVHVDTDGKSDAEIAAEIRDQLDRAGLTDSQVGVRTEGGGREVDIHADDGQGRQYRLVQHAPAGAPVEMEAGGIDDTREPGMSDAELEAKIVRQLRERGLDPEVTVDGDRIQIRARRRK
jgi:hypothetical protein